MSWQEEAATELRRITGNHAHKKRETILAIVDARIAGRSEETVWQLPNTCARSTYHDKWKKDKAFADALATVTELVRGMREEIAVESLGEAALRMALAAPAAVSRAIEKLSSYDEAVALRAAFGILDRAGMETATKQTSKVDGSINLQQMSDDELRAIIED